MSVPHTPRFEELLPAYALGALDGEELRELEEHLVSGCPECRRQLDLWQGDLEALAASVPALEPSETTRRRVLRVAGGAPASRPQIPRWLWLPAAALLLLSVWGVAGQMRLRGEVRRLIAERDRLEQRVAGLGREVGLARAEAVRTAEALQTITSPGVQPIVLAGLGSTPGAAGQTFVNRRQGRALFYAYDLPALASDKTYQLWFIAGGKPVSAGTFGVDERGRGSVRVESLDAAAEIQAWAVTVEPRGGVPQPTGEMVLKG
jgi:anti-sigma-K factor RskA